MKKLTRAVLIGIVGLWLGAAHASTATSEITDMWWNPNESGWGANIILQNNVAFMTFFVYDVAHNPVWYTSPLYFQGTDGTGAFVWTGNLYADTGPWFGGPFSTSNSTERQAGTVSFVLSSLDQATLSYTVDGVTVTKSVERQTWANENYTGSYAAGFSVRNFNCNPASRNGIGENVASLSVTQSGSTISMAVANALDSCTYTGTYMQTGKLGQAQGTFTCASGDAGTFNFIEMTPTVTGFTARVSGADPFCQWSGNVGAIHHAQ